MYRRSHKERISLDNWMLPWPNCQYLWWVWQLSNMATAISGRFNYNAWVCTRLTLTISHNFIHSLIRTQQGANMPQMATDTESHCQGIYQQYKCTSFHNLAPYSHIITGYTVTLAMCVCLCQPHPHLMEHVPHNKLSLRVTTNQSEHGSSQSIIWYKKRKIWHISQQLDV